MGKTTKVSKKGPIGQATKGPVPAAEWVETHFLVPWDQNPRVNHEAVQAVVKSIQRYGFGAPIVARLKDKMVIAGHTRLKAALSMGLKTVPVRYLDIDKREAKALALADNKVGEIAGWDEDMLKSVLRELKSDGLDLLDTGFPEKELARILDNDGMNEIRESREVSFDFLDVAESIRPKVIIAENVKGMMTGNAKGYCKLVLQRMRDLGYEPQLFLINAASCGVPQQRERVFFCAVRKDVSDMKLALHPDASPISASDACANLSMSDEERESVKHKSPSDLRWWPLTRPGESYAKAVERQGLNSKLFNHIRLHGARPSSTLAAVSSVYNHWSEPRKLTYAEWKRLGSFPDDYEAKTNNIGKYMIGMSVPPKMMQYVAGEVARQWFGV